MSKVINITLIYFRGMHNDNLNLKIAYILFKEKFLALVWLVKKTCTEIIEKKKNIITWIQIAALEG